MILLKAIDMTKNNGTCYSPEQNKESIKLMMPTSNVTLELNSKEEDISEVTLYKWRKETRAAGAATPGNGKTSDKWNSQDKFLVVRKTFAMYEMELSGYCRKVTGT